MISGYWRSGVTEYSGLAIFVQWTKPLAKGLDRPADTPAADASHVDISRRRQLATEEYYQIGELPFLPRDAAMLARSWES